MMSGKIIYGASRIRSPTTPIQSILTPDVPRQCRVYNTHGDPKCQVYRLSTFTKFPVQAPVDPVDLSAVGFLYTGYKDKVQCFCCNQTVEDWQLEDDVTSPKCHKNDCKMILNLECGNVPLSSLRPYQDWRPSSDSNQHHQTLKLQLAKIYSFSHECFVRSLNLHKEVDRMKTFTTWPAEPAHIKPEDLARSGFFYLGNLDRVQCFSCGIVLRDWKTGDVVHLEHKRHISDCRMVNGTDTSNIPKPTDEPLILARPPPSSLDEEPFVLFEQGLFHEVFSCRKPINPNMRNGDARLETFDSRWPLQSINATPKQIAEAGFYFLGERDRAKCWYCNGGLQNWERDDEPWTEHAKWFPTCEFVLQHKGPGFVWKILDKFPSLNRPFLRNGYNGPLLSILGVGSPQSYPPAIIDPNVDLKEQVRQAMESYVAKLAIQMGFCRTSVKILIRKKLEYEHEMYSNFVTLIDDLILDSTDEDRDHFLNWQLHEEIRNAQHLAEGRARRSENRAQILERRARSSEERARTSEHRARSLESTAQSSEDRVQRLEERVRTSEERARRMQSEKRCKVCLDIDATIVLLPCGHLCCCVDCAPRVTTCPICRGAIQRCMRTFLS